MLETALRTIRRRRDLQLGHPERVRKWGHRAYVGGADAETWYGIGRRQYHFLVAHGLRPSHRFLDIACGSLRLGQFLIPMLDEGHYFGLDGEADLVRQGLEHELLFSLAARKKPRFAFNYGFDFSFVDRFDVAMAQSLFTHLTPADIETCFRNLRPRAHAASRFFATFFEGDPAENPRGASHANRNWRYGFKLFEEIGVRTGWRVDHIGDWGHERGQIMFCATPSDREAHDADL